MLIRLDSYPRHATIPVREYLNNGKLAKYFNREAAAAMVCAARLLHGRAMDPDTPFYYETGRMEFEDYGLGAIVDASLDEQGYFNQQLFIAKGVKAVMPLTQFKALYNMPLSLLAIECRFTGDNAVIYASARGLFVQALMAPREKAILLGSGKVRGDGTVEVGFALIDKAEIRDRGWPDHAMEGIELLHEWYDEGEGG
jgi:hypothetical protein